LEKALDNYARSILTNPEKIRQIIKDNNLDVSDKTFTPVIPPNFINPKTFLKMARLEPKEDRYFLKDDNLFLIGSGEHTL
jgi:seryl-tRNA synthetase